MDYELAPLYDPDNYQNFPYLETSFAGEKQCYEGYSQNVPMDQSQRSGVPHPYEAESYPTNGVDGSVAVGAEASITLDALDALLSETHLPDAFLSDTHLSDPHLFPTSASSEPIDSEGATTLPLSPGLPTPTPSPPYYPPTNAISEEETPATYHPTYVWHQPLPNVYENVASSSSAQQYLINLNASFPPFHHPVHPQGQPVMSMGNVYSEALLYPEHYFQTEATRPASSGPSRGGRTHQPSGQTSQARPPYPTPPLEATHLGPEYDFPQTMGQTSGVEKVTSVKPPRTAQTKKVFPQNAVQIPCPVGGCPFIATGLDGLKEHLVGNPADFIFDHGLGRSKSSKERGPCLACQKEVSESSHVQHLLSVHTRISLHCRDGDCKLVFSRYDLLKAHCRAHHDGRAPCYDEVLPPPRAPQS
ncbi:hypothetical protein GALMADRAFT_783553 [Galerina marginata CBS 339.88]|uniref:C2H2-type domain-containing protein n=1 Tax=Galerina marginata (strain CBS 339.88) TaxID=685588 RepID=A0A067SPC0_GALM3|nr:hypothetical protein GALMADRAFT_783553 [Galerina marginata CBS 339.88]